MKDYKKLNYIAFDAFDGEYTYFATEEEAKKQAQEYINNYMDGEGIPENMTGRIGYAKVIEEAIQTTIADKKDFTEEEWEEENYSSDYDSICDIKLQKVE